MASHGYNGTADIFYYKYAIKTGKQAKDKEKSAASFYNTFFFSFFDAFSPSSFTASTKIRFEADTRHEI